MSALLFLANGCGGSESYEPGPDSDAGTVGSEGPDSGDSSGPEPAGGLTFDTFADGFLRNWCRGCHSSALEGEARNGAPEGVDFNTHADAERWRDRILERIAGDDPSMPPVGGPSDRERELMRDWLEAGAP